MNIKVDDMKSNTQSTVVSFLPHLAAPFTSVLTVSSALLPRIILHSILCFAGFLQLVFLCAKSIPRRIISFCIGLLDLWNPWKYGAKRGGGWRGGGTGEGSWNYTYRTFKHVRIYTTNSPLFSSAIAKPATYANAREKRHPRKVACLLATKPKAWF